MHIYEIAKLYSGTPGDWRRMIRELREGKKFMQRFYRPFREAAVAELKRPGTGRMTLDRFINALKESELDKGIDKKNRSAFRRFLRDARLQIGEVSQDLIHVGRKARTPVLIDGTAVSGDGHVLAYDANADLRVVHLHASTWKEPMRQAYVELLAMIAELRHGLTRESVLFLDVMTGEVTRPATRYKRLRQGLVQTIKLIGDIQDLFDRGAPEDGQDD